MTSQLTDAENEFFLGLYLRTIDYYQIKIEKRTGIVLGKISIWDFRQLHQHIMCNYEKRLGLIRAFLFRWRLHKFAQVLRTTYEYRSHNCGELITETLSMFHSLRALRMNMSLRN